MKSHTNKEICIPVENVAVFAQKLLIPILALLLIPYAWVKANGTGFELVFKIYLIELIHNIHQGQDIFKTLLLPLKFLFTPFNHPVLFGMALLIGIPVHEFLHALAAMIISGKGFGAVSFGFNKQAMAPYTHFSEPLKVWQYQLVLALPGIVLGVIPGIMAIILSSSSMMIFAYFYLTGALGDYMMLRLLKKFHARQLIKDHPGSLGFILVD